MRSHAIHSWLALPIAAAAAALLATAGACSKQSESSNASTNNGSGSSGGTAAGKTYVIGVVAKSQANPVFQAARTGAQDAARDLSERYGINVEIQWRTPNQEDAQQQASFVETLANQGVAGIAISVSDANVLTSAINAAANNGVEIVTFDSDAPNSSRFAYYGVNDRDAGRKVMNELARVMEGRGVVAVLSGNPNATNLAARVEGVREAARAFPNIEIRDVYYVASEQNNDMAARMQQVQTTNPDITGWALVGGWPLYTDNALDGIYETAKVVSMDPLELPIQYVKRGQVQVLVGQPYYGWGYESVRLIIDKLHNNVTPDSPMVFAEFDIVTESNADEYLENWRKWLGRN
jgi:ribose transport system substrate-binding protein